MLELVLTWKRFIDDIFLLFKGSRNECEMFVEWLNSLMPGIIKLDSKLTFLIKMEK